MKKKSPNLRTRRIVARKTAHRKTPKQKPQDIDLSQLIERLSKLRFSLQKLIVDALN
jgi:hypothetical protein